jgi:hypothetical protein
LLGVGISAKQLEGDWVHSHEEDSTGEIVFRPKTFNFPPSRGRYGFSLHPSGDLTERPIGATDRSGQQTGRWHLEPDGRLLLDIDADTGKATRVYRVISTSPDKLVLKK